MKNLAASLPDSRAVLKEAESQLEAARNMLKEAEAARYFQYFFYLFIYFSVVLYTVFFFLNIYISLTSHISFATHRDTAIGVKADVDGLLSGFSSTENSLSDLEDRLQNSMDLIDNLKVNLTQVGRQN